MILIPVKDLRTAKQRLAGLLNQSARTQLAQAMIHDVLATVAGWSNRPEAAVVTCDSFTVHLAAQYRFQIIPDNENRSETDAIEHATLARIFDPLTRGPDYQGEGDGSGSLGLGLYIASEIAKAHHGAIEARSDETETSFSVSLPRVNEP